MIKCKKCGKIFDSKEKTCPNCDALVYNGNSELKLLFEGQIKDYKANGYKEVKRDSNVVVLQKKEVLCFTSLAE